MNKKMSKNFVTVLSSLFGNGLIQFFLLSLPKIIMAKVNESSLTKVFRHLVLYN